MPDVNEDMFVPGEKVNRRPGPDEKAQAFLELQMRQEQQALEDRLASAPPVRLSVAESAPKSEVEEHLEDAIRAARRQQRELEQTYPYADGDHTVLGPEIFTDGTVISWKGENYVPQSHVQALRDIRAVAGVHCGALLELIHDGGVRMPEPALRVWQILYDELTLTMPALAENHPAVLPRLPEGME